MKVYCIFSGKSYEDSFLMHVVTTKAEAERVIFAYEKEYERDIANGEAHGGQYWYYLEEELLEKVQTNS